MIEVEHWDEARDGELSETSLRHKLESRGYRVSRYLYPPATRFPPHSHDNDKLDAVLSGRFLISVDGVAMALQAGDCLFIPSGVRHSAEVLGDDVVVSLDGVRD